MKSIFMNIVNSNSLRKGVAEKLIIKNYRKLYTLKAKHKICKTIKRLPNLILLFCLTALLTIGCKDEKTSQTKAQTEVKVDVKKDEMTKSNHEKVILFFGNSLTAGYGLDPSESFPSNIEDIIDSLDLKYKVINAGLSGETTSGGLNRIDWVMKQKVDIFILELGANDMLRGLPLDETRNNLSEIIKIVKSTNPDVKIGLCEMKSPPNMGDDYVKEFTKIYQDLSAPEDIVFFPFFLNGVAGNSDLMLQDGKHPNAKGQKIVAQNIWKVLKGML